VTSQSTPRGRCRRKGRIRVPCSPSNLLVFGSSRHDFRYGSLDASLPRPESACKNPHGQNGDMGIPVVAKPECRRRWKGRRVVWLGNENGGRVGEHARPCKRKLGKSPLATFEAARKGRGVAAVHEGQRRQWKGEGRPTATGPQIGRHSANFYSRHGKTSGDTSINSEGPNQSR
jgi:hypothetical protein